MSHVNLKLIFDQGYGLQYWHFIYFLYFLVIKNDLSFTFILSRSPLDVCGQIKSTREKDKGRYR